VQCGVGKGGGGTRDLVFVSEAKIKLIIEHNGEVELYGYCVCCEGMRKYIVLWIVAVN
jgi:hypothetical protein